MFRRTIKDTHSGGTILLVIVCGCETWSHIGPNRWWECQNRAMRKTSGPKRDDVTVEWKGQYNEGLYGSYFAPNVIRAIKSRRMRWLGHVARVGRREIHTAV
jgi:hypothetical protein